MKKGDGVEAALLAALGYLCFGFYEVVGRLAALRGFDLGPHLRTPIDDAIPFLPLFVLPYSLAFVMPVVTAVAVAVHGGLHSFRRVFFAYLGLLFVHFALYLAFPTSASGVMLPEAALGDGWLDWGVSFFYRLSPPWNACPSFHVAGAWFFYRILHRWAPRASRAYAVWFWIMFVSIAAIKIHWVIDGVAGWLLAEAWYRWVFVPVEARGGCSWEWSSPGQRLAVHLVPIFLLGAGLAWALFTL